MLPLSARTEVYVSRAQFLEPLAMCDETAIEGQRDSGPGGLQSSRNRRLALAMNEELASTQANRLTSLHLARAKHEDMT